MALFSVLTVILLGYLNTSKGNLESGTNKLLSQVELEEFAMLGPSFARSDRDAHMYGGKHYFRNLKQVPYDKAMKLCSSAGPKVHILEIRTQEELTNVKSFLDASDDNQETYWVGGKFHKGQWEWEDGTVVNTDMFHWEAGSSQFGLDNELRRITIQNGVNLKSKPMPKDAENRVICEYNAYATLSFSMPPFKSTDSKEKSKESDDEVDDDSEGKNKGKGKKYKYSSPSVASNRKKGKKGEGNAEEGDGDGKGNDEEADKKNEGNDDAKEEKGGTDNEAKEVDGPEQTGDEESPKETEASER